MILSIPYIGKIKKNCITKKPYQKELGNFFLAVNVGLVVSKQAVTMVTSTHSCGSQRLYSRVMIKEVIGNLYKQ